VIARVQHPDTRVVLLHGLMGTASSHFGEAIRHWHRAYRLYPVDLPGHGSCGADAPPGYYGRVVDWFCRALDRVGPAHVIGASYLGGTVALHAARRRPELVRSLVLSGYTAEVPASAFAAWSTSFRSLADARPELQDLYRRLHGERWSATLAAVTEDCRSSYAATIAARWDALETLPIPVLLANGDLKQNERDAANHYAGGRGAVTGRAISGAGHLPMVDRPADFAAVVEDFWGDQRSR
jgi:pimeloyl-ACP methyl ester carboxylesterase